MGVFLRIIGPLAEAMCVSLYDEVAIISDIVIIFH
jgi:hypothetical protein